MLYYQESSWFYKYGGGVNEVIIQYKNTPSGLTKTQRD